MRYENLVIFKSEIGETGINKEVEKFVGIIEKGGKSINVDRWGLRQLAYPIRKKESGYYVLFEFEADGKVLSELGHTLKLDEDVLRYCIMRKGD